MSKIIITFIVAVFLAPLLINVNLISIGAVFFLLLFPIFIIRPQIYFIAFIILRPLFDLVAEINVAGINLASLFTISLILICGLDLLKKENWHKIKETIFLRQFNKLFLSFLFISLFSFLNTEDFLISLSDFIRFSSVLIAVNYAVVYFSSSEKLKKLIIIILFSAITPLVYGFCQLVFKTGMAEKGMNRIHGPFVHCNVFAEYLLFVFFVLLFIFPRTKTKAAKFSLASLIFLTIFELYNTFTRTAWIALAVTILIYIFLDTRAFKKIIYLLTIIMVFFLVFSGVKERFEDISRKRGSQSSWKWRIALWEESIPLLKKHPFIGNGLGMYEYKIGAMAHNDWLRITYELGIPAVGLFLGLFIYL